jgi:hypothetical protein
MIIRAAAFQNDTTEIDRKTSCKGLARINASHCGLKKVDQARKRKGWSKNAEAWYGIAFTSESTLKRFWRQKRISVDSFINICAAVGIEDWQSIADWSN